MTEKTTVGDGPRREQVLGVALEVFGRYGFRKASMDEVARAAEISRQGLYLYFASKEALFRAAVEHELRSALSAASAFLDTDAAPLTERVAGALDAWLGRFVGTLLARDLGNLLDNSAMQLGDMVDGFTADFELRLSRVIAAGTAEKDRLRLGVTPEEVAATLHLTGRGWKYQVGSRAEFTDKVNTTVRLVLAGLTDSPSAPTRSASSKEAP